MAVSSANGFGRLVVLVVEDEFIVRHDIASYLRNCRCVVLEAGTAEEAIEISRDDTVDVLLTDIDLNGPLNGWDVAQTLRAVQPRVGVIYVSGNSVDPSRRVTESLFFSKPYRQADLLQACRALAHL